MYPSEVQTHAFGRVYAKCIESEQGCNTCEPRIESAALGPNLFEVGLPVVPAETCDLRGYPRPDASNVNPNNAETQGTAQAA